MWMRYLNCCLLWLHIAFAFSHGARSVWASGTALCSSHRQAIGTPHQLNKHTNRTNGKHTHCNIAVISSRYGDANLHCVAQCVCTESTAIAIQKHSLHLHSSDNFDGKERRWSRYTQCTIDAHTYSNFSHSAPYSFGLIIHIESWCCAAKALLFTLVGCRNSSGAATFIVVISTEVCRSRKFFFLSQYLYYTSIDWCSPPPAHHFAYV